MGVTLKNLKVKGRWKAESKMSMEELKYYNEYKQKHREETERLEGILEHYNSLCKDNEIVLPMYLTMRRKNVPDKKIAINMNGYRNWDHMSNNIIKTRFKEVIIKFIKKFKKFNNPIHITYTIYYDREPDGMNVSSTISKYFLDTLQEEGIIENDNIEFVTESYKSGGRDKDNTRVLATINNL